SVTVISELVFALFWAISLGMTLLFVVARMLHIGLSVEPAEITALARDRGFVVRALVANVLVVPAAGVAIALLLPLPREAAMAILLLAAVGGGIDFLALVERPT